MSALVTIASLLLAAHVQQQPAPAPAHPDSGGRRADSSLRRSGGEKKRGVSVTITTSAGDSAARAARAAADSDDAEEGEGRGGARRDSARGTGATVNGKRVTFRRIAV